MKPSPQVEPVDIPLPPHRQVARLLLRLDRFRHLMRQHGGLNAADLRLLWLLCEGRPRTLREISEILTLEQSTVNRQVKAAVTAGLLHRFRPEGESVLLIEPTAAGRAAFERDTEVTLAQHEAALAALGDGAEEFLDQLGRFTAAYGRSVRTVTRPGEHPGD